MRDPKQLRLQPLESAFDRGGVSPLARELFYPTPGHMPIFAQIDRFLPALFLRNERSSFNESPTEKGALSLESLTREDLTDVGARWDP